MVKPVTQHRNVPFISTGFIFDKSARIVETKQRVHGGCTPRGQFSLPTNLIYSTSLSGLEAKCRVTRTNLWPLNFVTDNIPQFPVDPLVYPKPTG